MALDRIPGEFNIFIGGFISLRRKDALKAANVTHVVSVVDWNIDEDLIKGYRHLSIKVNDVDDEKLINHFNDAVGFIDQGLRDGGGVLVHCAMGKSRSATICIAYLLWKSAQGSTAEPLDPESALSLLRQSRPLAEPNDGFMEQLKLYHEMGCPEKLDEEPRYQRWLYQQILQENLAIGRAPEMNEILFEDERFSQAVENKGLSIKCRKCRRTLADARFVTEHTPSDGSGQCGQVYIQPLSWMRDSLQSGKLDGRLTCPNERCGANVGKFAWQGQKCTCGQWVTPAFSLIRGKVDEAVAVRRDAKIRLPPGLTKNGNL